MFRLIPIALVVGYVFSTLAFGSPNASTSLSVFDCSVKAPTEFSLVSTQTGCGLGVSWDEAEVGGWKGVWTRIGSSNEFDAQFSAPNGVSIRAKLEVKVDRRNVSIFRWNPGTWGICSYIGTFSADFSTVSGLYQCTDANGNWSAQYQWNAKINCPGGGGGGGDAVQANWATRVRDVRTDYRGTNMRVSFNCPAGGSPGGSLWGGADGIYTDDSMVCHAAVFAGLITYANGGRVTIEMRPGAQSYTGGTRNGITVSGHGPFAGSYVFVR